MIAIPAVTNLKQVEVGFDSFIFKCSKHLTSVEAVSIAVADGPMVMACEYCLREGQASVNKEAYTAPVYLCSETSCNASQVSRCSTCYRGFCADHVYEMEQDAKQCFDCFK